MHYVQPKNGLYIFKHSFFDHVSCTFPALLGRLKYKNNSTLNLKVII